MYHYSAAKYKLRFLSMADAWVSVPRKVMVTAANTTVNVIHWMSVNSKQNLSTGLSVSGALGVGGASEKCFRLGREQPRASFQDGSVCMQR